MGTLTERRDTRRIVVGPEYAISFTLKGHAFHGVRISNLSVGGCFALVGPRDARLFFRGTALDRLVLAHPDLPKQPIIAAVAYVLGGRPGHDPQDLVGVGIEFVCMETPTREALAAWVEAAATATEQA